MIRNNEQSFKIYATYIIFNLCFLLKNKIIFIKHIKTNMLISINITKLNSLMTNLL